MEILGTRCTRVVCNSEEKQFSRIKKFENFIQNNIHFLLNHTTSAQPFLINNSNLSLVTIEFVEWAWAKNLQFRDTGWIKTERKAFPYFKRFRIIQSFVDWCVYIGYSKARWRENFSKFSANKFINIEEPKTACFTFSC